MPISKLQLDEEQETRKKLADKFGDAYYEMWGKLILGGMDIHTATWECWNNLECGGKNE